MDAKLKTKLDDAIAAALKWRQKRIETGACTPRTAVATAKTGLASPKTAVATAKTGVPTAKTAPETRAETLDKLTHLVKQKLERTASWRAVQRQLAMDSLAQLLSKEIERRECAAAAQDQLPLPGFEDLPKRIGRTATGATSVRRFLAYAARYEKQADRNLRTLAQIRTMVKTLQPFAATEPALTVTEAINRGAAMATAPPRALALVAGTKLA